ncbi:MAG: RNase H-like domain-containing protein [Candidatus Phytoplasma australasiaticum]|nr:RNase H-like domain-containing protein [Candidatus Phytoplasma australasiaticum]
MQYSPLFEFDGGPALEHPTIVADMLPVDILLGNDLLRRLKGAVDWKTETARLEWAGVEYLLPRWADDGGASAEPRATTASNILVAESRRLGDIDVSAAHDSPISLLTCNEGLLEPRQLTAVQVHAGHVVPELPAVCTPKRLLGSDSIFSLESVVTSAMEVYIFNDSDEQVTLPAGTRVATIDFEDRGLDPATVVPGSLGEVCCAVAGGRLELESCDDQLSGTLCSVAEGAGVADRPLLPSLEEADISPAQRDKVRHLLHNYRHVFAYELKPGAFIPNAWAHLERKVNSTIFKKNWPWSEMQRRLAEQEVAKLLKAGVIEEGFAKFCTLPVFVIAKRGSTLEAPVGRVLLDARALNNTLAEYKYKATTISDALRYCSDKNLLCVGDIVSYFFTIRVTDESKEYLGFQVGEKRYRFTRLAQGLKTAPQIAQSMMGYVLAGLPVCSYLDDLIVGGTDFDSLFSVFEQTLHRLSANNLCLRPDKTILFRKTVPMLGVIVEAGRKVRPDKSRFRPLLALKYPKNARALKSCICFLSYYRRYIPKFAIRTSHYNEMANEKCPFVWTEENAADIESMYTHLLNNATLSLFDEKRPTKLHVDASQLIGVGAFLAQKEGNYYLPVGYFSANLNKTQKAWSSFHLECLALFSAVRCFESELLSVEKFTVVTDCSSLRYLLSMQAPKAPLDRFIAYLSTFTFDFEVVGTRDNKIPDSLSRLHTVDGDIPLPACLDTEFNAEAPQEGHGAVLQVITRAARRRAAEEGEGTAGEGAGGAPLPAAGPEQLVRQAAADGDTSRGAPRDDDVARASAALPHAAGPAAPKEGMPPDSDVKAGCHGPAAPPPLAAIKRLQRLDPQLAPIFEALAGSQPTKQHPALYVRGKRAYTLRDGLLVTNTAPAATVIPAALVPQVLNLYHDLCLHAGERVMLLALCKYYFWPSMGRDVKDYVRSCTL